MTRPAHRRPVLVAVVAAGGAVGTLARYGVGLALGRPGGWPAGTFLVNAVGAFALGVLLEALVRRGEETPRGRLVRLALGTGVLGGFTTFSSLAVEVERLIADGAPGQAAAYAAATLVAGLLAAAAGVALGARRSGAGPRRERADAERAAAHDAAQVDARRTGAFGDGRVR